MIERMSIRCGIFVLSAVFAACNSSEPRSTPAVTSAPAATSSEVTGIVPKNAIVTLLPASGEPPMPAEPAVLDQISKQFLPHTLLARVGQPVEFRNSEDMPHNVSVVRRESGSEVFNVGTGGGPEAGSSVTIAFFGTTPVTSELVAAGAGAVFDGGWLELQADRAMITKMAAVRTSLIIKEPATFFRQP